MFQALKATHVVAQSRLSNAAGVAGESVGRPGVAISGAAAGPTPSALPVPESMLAGKENGAAAMSPNTFAGSPGSAMSSTKADSPSAGESPAAVNVPESVGRTESAGKKSPLSFAAIAGQLVTSKMAQEGSALRGENDRLKEAMQAHVQITKRKIDALQAQMAEANAFAVGVREKSEKALLEAESKLKEALDEVSARDEALRARDKLLEEMSKDKHGEKDKEVLKGMLARVEAAEAKVIKAEARVAKLQRERDEAMSREEGQVAALKAQLEELVLEAAAESEAEVQRVAAEGAMREREAMKTAVEADEARAQAEALLREAEGKVESLQSRIAGLMDEMERVQGSARDATSAAGKLAAEAGAETSRLATLLQDAEARLGEADLARSAMETRANFLAGQVEEAQSMVEEARKAAAEAVQAKEALAKDFACLSASMEDLKSAHVDLQSARQEAVAMKEEVDAAKSALADMERRASDLDREKHAAILQAEELAAALAHGAAERTTLVGEVRAAEVAKAELAQALETSESSRAEREACMQELENELKSLERLVVSTSADVEEEKAARLAAESRVEKAEAENARLLRDSEEALRMAEGKVLRSVQEAMSERSKKEALAEMNARLLQDSEEALLREKEALRAERAAVFKLEEAQKVHRELTEQHARDIEELRTARYQSLRADMEEKVGSPTGSGPRNSPGATSAAELSPAPGTPEQTSHRLAEPSNARTPGFGQLGSPAQALMPKPRAWPKHVQGSQAAVAVGAAQDPPIEVDASPKHARGSRLRSVVARLGSAAAIGSMGAVCVLLGALKVSPTLSELARVNPVERQRRAQKALDQVRPNGVPASDLPFDLKRTQTFSIDLMA